MPSHTHERRKQLVVNRPMQSRLVLNMALLPAIALAGIAAFTGVYCARLVEEAAVTDSELPALMPLFYLVIAFELLAAIFLLINSLKISHKVAGPAYRICKSLERIRSGDLAFNLQLRKGDHLTEIKDEVNRLLDWLNENPPAGCVTRTMATQRQAEPPTPGDAGDHAAADAALPIAATASQTDTGTSTPPASR